MATRLYSAENGLQCICTVVPCTMIAPSGAPSAVDHPPGVLVPVSPPIDCYEGVRKLVHALEEGLRAEVGDISHEGRVPDRFFHMEHPQLEWWEEVAIEKQDEMDPRARQYRSHVSRLCRLAVLHLLCVHRLSRTTAADALKHVGPVDEAMIDAIYSYGLQKARELGMDAYRELSKPQGERIKKHDEECTQGEDQMKTGYVA